MGYKNRWNDVTPKEHQNKMPDINKFPPVLLGLPWRKNHKRKKSGLTSQKISTSQQPSLQFTSRVITIFSFGLISMIWAKKPRSLDPPLPKKCRSKQIGGKNSALGPPTPETFLEFWNSKKKRKLQKKTTRFQDLRVVCGFLTVFCVLLRICCWVLRIFSLQSFNALQTCFGLFLTKPKNMQLKS